MTSTPERSFAPQIPADESHVDRWARQTREQETVNRLAARYGTDVARRAALALAKRDHAQYPQYHGYWEGWDVAEITTRLASKGGTQAEPGDVVLYKNGEGHSWSTWSGTFYSVRLGWNCSVSYGVKAA